MRSAIHWGVVKGNKKQQHQRPVHPSTMGKQSRNKRHRQGKSKCAPALSAEGSSEKAPALLQRLRHADEGTRQAALAALELNPRLLHVSSHHRERLLEAVRDQLMGSSVEVSTQACAVMIAYLSMSSYNEDLAASWLNLLVQRLQTCLDRLRPASGSPTASPLQRLQILKFASRCLECFALLIEVNPLATRRLVRSQVDVLSVLHPWLERHDAEVGSASDYVEICELACQCLHSVLDNNEEIISPWFDQAWEAQTHSRNTVLALEALLMTDPAHPSLASSVVSSLARLHAAGAWLSIWCLIPAGKVGALASLLQSHLNTCVRLLVAGLVDLDEWIRSTDSVDSLPGMLERVNAAYLEWKQLRQDVKLENDVVASQTAKRESARSIARRLKARSEEEARPPPPPSTLAQSASSTAMVVEPDGDEMNEASRTHASTRNPEVEWETSRCSWLTKLRPSQLSLEILLNITSLADDDTDSDDEDYTDARMDDADAATASLDGTLVATLLRWSQPDVVQRLLASLTAALLSSSTSSIPTTVQLSLGDLVHKAGTLLGHAMANVPSWQPGDTLWSDLVTSLEQFLSLLEATVEGTPNEAAAPAHKGNGTAGVDEAVEGITSALVMSVQAKRLKCPQLEPVMSSLVPALQAFVSPAVQRNVVCLIGLLLCAEASHPQQLNEQVCRALLGLLDKASGNVAADSPGSSAMVAAEVCNVLIDLYGSDDDNCHRAVYDTLGVSKCMERVVPCLRRFGEVETAINAKRFVQYMKEQS